MSGEAFRKPIQRLLCLPARVDQPEADAQVVRADCGHPVWMKPSGVQLWQTKRILALCLPCGLASRNPNDPVGLRIAPAQHQQLVAAVGSEEAQRLMDTWGVTSVVEPE